MNSRNCKNCIELNELEITKAPRCGIGLYRTEEIMLVFNMMDFYLVGCLAGTIFYTDKDQVKNGTWINEVIRQKLPAECKIIVLNLNYCHLPMDKPIKIDWKAVESRLTSHNPTKIAQGIASAIVLTAESWRFFPVATACEKFTNVLSLGELRVCDLVDGLSAPARESPYTLRELLNDWSKLSKGNIEYNGSQIPFTVSDISRILRCSKVHKWIHSLRLW